MGTLKRNLLIFAAGLGLVAALLLAFGVAWPSHGTPAHYRTWHGKQLPDPVVTPGEVALADTKKVCTTKWGKDARAVTAKMKADVYTLYGAVKKAKVCCEVDHLISRELGGADALKNLWPQPWEEAHEKDRLENWLHGQVCEGKMSLLNAQHRIAANWAAAFIEAFPEEAKK